MAYEQRSFDSFVSRSDARNQPVAPLVGPAPPPSSTSATSTATESTHPGLISRTQPTQSTAFDSIQTNKNPETMAAPEVVTSHASSLLPIPAATDPTDTSAVPENERPSDSHALAHDAVHEQVGASQEIHTEPEVRDLGWNAPIEEVAKPLVGGLPNEELWTLIRRFNKQMYHVKAMHTAPPGGLDLNIADEEEFSPDKLRANVERLYMTVIVGMAGFFKHIARLRSWNERKRTSAFMSVYFLAWIFNMIAPLFVCLLITLIVYPRARTYLFPPAPLALVNASTGGLQEPKAGMLGSGDSLTGAPQKHQGEAVEQEASNFVTSFASIAISSATGKEPTTEAQDKADGSLGGALPDPTQIASRAADAKASAAGDTSDVNHDKTKKPVEEAMWLKMRPVMHIIGDICDGWERFGNALSPTPPFPKNIVQYRLAGLVAPLLIPALLVNAHMVAKGATFGAGVGFFGQPLITRSMELLNRKFPHWAKLLEIRNTILKGVPTNAQLTITLLRMGEANKAPLPYKYPGTNDRIAADYLNSPPPRSDDPPSEVPINAHHDEDYDLAGSLDASPEDLHAAMHPDLSPPPQYSETSASKPIHGDDGQHPADKAMGVATPSPTSPTKKKHNFGAKVLSIFKSTTKATVETALGADRLKASAGSTAAKNRRGVIPKPHSVPEEAGPVDFPCRYKGKKGILYVSTSATTPCISFSYTGAAAEGTSKIKSFLKHGTTKHASDNEDPREVIGSEDAGETGSHLKPIWSCQIKDVHELKKIGGLGWKGKLVVGWALDTSVADGLEIVGRGGHKWQVTAIQLREELFNRLVAMGDQRWESW